MTSASEARRLFVYNDWANRAMLEALATVPPETYLADRGSSHGGMHGTMLHVVWAHYLWLLRWLAQPNDEAMAWKKGVLTLEALRAGWNDLDARTNAFLDARLSDAWLAETYTMHTTKGERFVHTYGESMQHLILHSGYHRGQVTGLIRQAGLTPPGTDYIMFARLYPDPEIHA